MHIASNATCSWKCLYCCVTQCCFKISYYDSDFFSCLRIGPRALKRPYKLPPSYSLKYRRQTLEPVKIKGQLSIIIAFWKRKFCNDDNVWFFFILKNKNKNILFQENVHMYTLVDFRLNFNTFLTIVIQYIVSENCLHYLTMDNWFNNFHLLYLQ